MVDSGGQNLVIEYLVPHMVYYEKRPVAVATSMRFSTVTTFLRRALQAPQMQDARITPEQAWQYTLHILEATMLSIARHVDVPEHHRAEQGGHYRQHGGRASVRLYSQNDLWPALARRHLWLVDGEVTTAMRTGRTVILIKRSESIFSTWKATVPACTNSFGTPDVFSSILAEALRTFQI